jgi:hypothetical protein
MRGQPRNMNRRMATGHFGYLPDGARNAKVFVWGNPGEEIHQCSRTGLWFTESNIVEMPDGRLIGAPFAYEIPDEDNEWQ